MSTGSSRPLPVDAALTGSRPQRLLDASTLFGLMAGFTLLALAMVLGGAPALGLIGTLVGLMQMLRNLDSPALMGPAMAVALLTTFYGAVLGHMVFTSLAVKLERKANAEAGTWQLYILPALSVSRRENTHLFENAINSILPPRKRINVFD